MKEPKSKVILYLDSQTEPLGEYEAPIRFELDTRKIPDGEHTLKIVSIDPMGTQGVKYVPFTIRNGPAIALEGLKEHDTIGWYCANYD